MCKQAKGPVNKVSTGSVFFGLSKQTLEFVGTGAQSIVASEKLCSHDNSFPKE